jgi:hypothetical protein
MHYIADILEQSPDLITGLPQTEHISVPVKTSWVLKPEYQQFCKDYYISMPFELEVEPKQHKEYYYVTETLDYSQIPVGAIIEINNFQHVGKVVDPKELPENWHNGITISPPNGYIMNRNIPFSEIKYLTILKLPEDIK